MAVMVFILIANSQKMSAQNNQPTPQIIKEYNDKIYNSLHESKDYYKSAMIEFREAIKNKSDTKPNYSGAIFDLIWNEAMGYLESAIPFSGVARKSYNLAKKVVNTLYAESKKGVKGGRLTAKDWVQNEIDNLDERFKFLRYSALLDSLSKAYLAINSETEKQAFTKGLESYHNAIVKHIPQDSRTYEIKIYEKWITKNYNELAHETSGVLISLVKINDRYGASREKFLVRTPFGAQIGKRLNSLLVQKKMTPMDLKVNKLLIVKGLGITNCSQCSQVLMFGKYNKRLWWPNNTDLGLSARLNRLITDDMKGSRGKLMIREEFFGGNFN